MKPKKSLLIVSFVSFVSLLIAAPLFGASKNSTKPIELHFSETGPAHGITYKAAHQFKKEVEQRSEGNVKIVLHMQAELFGPKQEIDALSKGDIEIAALHHALSGSRSGAIEFITAIGARGCFQDLNHYWRFLDTPEVRDIIHKELETKFNAKLLWMAPVGGPAVGTIKPIHSIRDFKGLKLRTPGAASALAYSTLGATPAQLSSTELYMALDRGTVDACDTSLANIYYSKLYEVTPYITLDGSAVNPHALVSINLDVWNKLPEQYKNILLEVAKDVAQSSRINVVEQGKMLVEKFNTGIVKELYIFPEKEISEVIQLIQPKIHDYLVKSAGAAEADILWKTMEATRN